MNLILTLILATQFMSQLFLEREPNKESFVSDYALVRKPTMTLIGIECRTSNDPDAAPHDIPLLWNKFYTQDILGKIPNKASEEVIALYCDYEGDYTGAYSCVIGCPVTSLDQIPPGMVVKTIPASTFASYKAVGEFPKSVVDTWGAIWQTPLKRTYLGDYEVYGKNFAGPTKEVEILVAIEEFLPL